MIYCPATSDTFRCPTKWELWRQIMALLPRGRAWQTHEAGGPETIETGFDSQLGPFQIGVTPLGAVPTIERLSVLEQFWAAYAELLEYFHQRACALIEEYYCATATEQVAEWGVDYAFPDSCEPWEALCDKVAAQGGATCAYLAVLAARLGYSIECLDCRVATKAAADCAVADCTPLDCECPGNVITIRIHASSASGVAAPVPFAADSAVADCTPPCAVAPETVICLIERFKPAHVRALYEVV